METECCDRARLALSTEVFGRPFARIGRVGTKEVKGAPSAKLGPCVRCLVVGGRRGRMGFERQPAHEWQRAVPGARWFKADLHIHTVDDHAGGRAGLPEGLDDDPNQPRCSIALRKTVSQRTGCERRSGRGLTPHSSRPKRTRDQRSLEDCRRVELRRGRRRRSLSREGLRRLPGFEPNVNDGANGVHLLFLFDPEIGRERYLALYDAIMDGRAPWEHSALRLTPRDAEEVFQTLDRRRRRVNGPTRHGPTSRSLLTSRGSTVYSGRCVVKSSNDSPAACSPDMSLVTTSFPRRLKLERTRKVPASLHVRPSAGVLSRERCLLH